MATTSPRPPSPPSHKDGGKSSKPQGRMFRSLSRFLTGGGGSNKQSKQQPPSSSTRPVQLDDTRANSDSSRVTTGGGGAGGVDLGVAGGASPSTSLVPPDTTITTTTSSHSNHNSSRSGSVSTAGRDSSLIAQYPQDSLSHISRPDSSSSFVDNDNDHDGDDDRDDDDADTDASLYRLPPSTRPPSSITSGQTTHTQGSTSSFAPTHASTYKSYASTKPTTLLSVDSGAGGNRIAVVPGTGSHLHQQHHQSMIQPPHPPQPYRRQSGGGEMTTSTSGNSLSLPPTSNPTSSSSSSTNHPHNTFSSLSPTFVPSHQHRPSTSSTTSSLSINNPLPLNVGTDSTTSRTGDGGEIVRIPSHTQAHPRNNPHPTHFPQDNASLLTLASSSFAPSFTLSTNTNSGEPVQGSSGSRPTVAAASTSGGGTNGGGGRNYSWGGGGLTSLKAWSAKRGQTGEHKKNSSISVGGMEGGMGMMADEDASVRVLPGSRRNSEESLGGKSTWSAMVPNPPGVVGGGGRSILSFKVTGDELDKDGRDGMRDRERRRSSMKTVETGKLRDDENEEEEEKRRSEGGSRDGEGETETEEAGGGETQVREETEAEGVKKLADQRTDPIRPSTVDTTTPVVVDDENEMGSKDEEMEKEKEGDELNLAPPVPTIGNNNDST